MLDCGHVIKQNDAVGVRAKHGVLDLAELFETRIRNDEIKFVVLLEATDRDEHIGSRERARDLGYRHLERLQFVRIDGDPVFFNATALHTYARDSGNSGERRAQSVKREIAQLDQRVRIRGEAVSDHRKYRRVHAFHFERRAGGQARQNLIHLRLALEHGRNHFFAQSKFTETSALPRLVADLILRTPGIARTASSTGVVTSTAI